MINEAPTSTELSYKHAINVARLLYEREGFELPEKSPGTIVAIELGINLETSKLGALFALIDEVIYILRVQSIYLAACLTNDANKDAITQLRFCTAMLSTLASIRVLSAQGFDLNARSQLRYYYELSMLWSRIQVDKSALEEFQLTKLDQTNAYWHKYMSRRKCEDFLFSGVESGSFLWLGGSARTQIDEIYQKLSLSGHPSFWGLTFDTQADFLNLRDGVIGRGSENASIFTLSSALFLSSLPFGINSVTDWCFQIRDLFMPNELCPRRTDSISWTEYCHYMRRMLLSIVLFSFEFTNRLSAEIRAERERDREDKRNR